MSNSRVLTLLLVAAILDIATSYDYYGGIGQPCKDLSYWDGFRRRGTCDESRGYTCQNYPEYGGFVCACPAPYAYDPQSDECRLPLRSNCIRPSGVPLAWYEKCQDNAECVPAYKVSGKIAGTCQCKPGYYLSYGGDFCER